MGWFDSRKTKELKKIKAGDKIIINCPSGFNITKSNLKLYNQPTSVFVVNNDTHKKQIWVQLTTSDSSIFDFTLDYNSKELENFVLFNIITEKKKVKPKSKKELEAELKNAILHDDFETAAIINQKIKDAKD